MKTLILISFMTLISTNSYSQKAELLLVDENIDAEELKDKFNIRKGSTKKSYLPNKDLRDFFLKNVPDSRSWDEYQKDSFYMDIKNKSIDEIHKKYPHFSVKKIKELKDKL